MQISRTSHTPQPTPTLTNSPLKNRSKSSPRKPMFFKKLFAALTAVTRTAEMAVLVEVSAKLQTHHQSSTYLKVNSDY